MQQLLVGPTDSLGCCCVLWTCRGGAFVLIPTTDLVFYALGSGEYDEMARERQQHMHRGLDLTVSTSAAEAAGTRHDWQHI